jgi:hypothetical protein
MTVIVNCIGAPGAGKTHTSIMIMEQLVLRNKSFVFIQEQAQLRIYNGYKLNSDQEYQALIYDTCTKLKEYISCVDYIVTDGPLLGIQYYLKDHPSLLFGFNNLLSKIHEHDNRYIFSYLNEERERSFSERNRLTNIDDSKNIEKYLLSLDINYITYSQFIDSL